MSIKEKNGVPSVQIVDFKRESSSVGNFFLVIFVHTLKESSRRINEPNYKKRALKKGKTIRDCEKNFKSLWAKHEKFL